MSFLNRIVTDFSPQRVHDFFFDKINSFQPDEDVFYDMIPEDTPFDDPVKIGEAVLESEEEILVFLCRYQNTLTQRSGKKQQFDIAKKIMNEDFKDGAICFFYDDSGSFRMSLVRRYYGEDQKYSTWKRFSYFVQPHKQNKTFLRQVGLCQFSSLDAIEEAFGIEALSKEFYKELSYWYFAALREVTFPAQPGENQHQINSQAMIRLITRIMFVWFMKEKGLIPHEIFDKEYIDEILNHEDSTGSTYYKAILQNLFFATLNTEMGEKRKWITSSGYGVQHFFRYRRFFHPDKADDFLEKMREIPFLNGGLFENLDIVETADKEKGIDKIDIRIDCFSDNRKNETRLVVPDYLFFGSRVVDLSSELDSASHSAAEVEGLIDLLNRYDFTIDENSPDDQEVALDPELLGTVFENLLASYNPETQSTARKESGSFYTPRPIVDYMVRESLFHHLKNHLALSLEELRILLESKQADHLSEEDKKSIIDQLTRIRILDPACGSGAFPMGVLQEMVRLLNVLDPENILYKEKLQEKLKEDLQKTIDQSNFEELRDNIEAVFENQLNDPDYARKLFLIQNCLYGVDIQSIALQITKLRFFISLLVEQEIDPDEENLGIKPLPNLETKFVAANTLIGLNQNYEIRNLEIQDLEEELAQVRERYFNARSYPTKRKYRIRDKELREEISRRLVDDGWGEESAHRVSRWDPFDQNASSDWFDPEWMFGTNAFDLVIGNPPYIQLQKALPNGSDLKYGDLYQDEGYETFARTGDIYGLFYEKGLNLTTEGGLLCYITSNKWMRANYGKKLRKFFTKKDPLLLLDLGPGIFASATVDTNILILRNRRPRSHDLQALPLKDASQIDFLYQNPMTRMTDLSEESWIILTPEEMAIKEKIERIGTPLKDWDINIYRGVLTGYNEAFIIDGAKRKELIEEDPKSAEIIKPLLRGRDIKRYKAEFADLWLINSHNGYYDDNGNRIPRIKIEDYPAIKKHLDTHWERIEKRYDQGDTPYNLRNCAYLNEFEKEKIVWAETIKEFFDGSRNFPRFTLDSKSHFNDKTVFMLLGDNLRIKLAILNSKVIEFYLRREVTILGSGSMGLAKIYIELIPIILPQKEIQINLAFLIDIILSKKEAGEVTSAEEREIDLMVYHLYELTYDEVKIVDPEFWMSREEYENYQMEAVE